MGPGSSARAPALGGPSQPRLMGGAGGTRPPDSTMGGPMDFSGPRPEAPTFGQSVGGLMGGVGPQPGGALPQAADPNSYAARMGFTQPAPAVFPTQPDAPTFGGGNPTGPTVLGGTTGAPTPTPADPNSYANRMGFAQPAQTMPAPAPMVPPTRYGNPMQGGQGLARMLQGGQGPRYGGNFRRGNLFQPLRSWGWGQ